MNEPYLPHRFNPQVAEVYGIPAALIFQYICFRSRLTPNRWVDPTLGDICKQYPYLGSWQVWVALKKLTNAGRKTPPLVFRKQVKGDYLYAPATNDETLALHTFDVRVAVKLGIPAALLFHNIGYWIKRNWQQRAEFWYERLNPEEFDDDDFQMQRFAYQMTRGAAAHYTTTSEWVTQHPYISLRNAERGLVLLQEAGLLRKGYQRRHKQFWHLTRKTLVDFEQEMLGSSDLLNRTAKTQSQTTKPKVKRQNPNSSAKTQTEHGLNRCAPDSCKPVVEAVFVEATLRVKKPFRDNIDVFQPPSSLADARGESAGTASRAASPLVEIRRMNFPNQPEMRKKVLRDGLGHPVKRTYVRKPKPDDPEFYEYLDGLTPEKRQVCLSAGDARGS